tara:strand:+ start:426 stop:734 length:309 start_codon:yes stop_codon:yes gene_type:complete
MTMSEGKLEYILTKETKVNIQVSDIINELAHIVDNKLADYYLYQEKPYIDTSSGEEYVEITLNGNDECESGSPVEWRPLFTKAIKRYAQDIADGIEERGPEE